MIDLTRVKLPVLFHGGCHGCTQQQVHGLRFCKGCCYFKPDWNLPDLNNRPLTLAEQIKQFLLEED